MPMYSRSMIWAFAPSLGLGLPIHPGFVPSRADSLRREGFRRAKRLSIRAFAKLADRRARRAGRADSTVKRIGLAVRRFTECFEEYRPGGVPTLTDLNNERILADFFAWLSANFGPDSARNLGDPIGGVLNRAKEDGLIAGRRMPKDRPGRSRSRKRAPTPPRAAFLLRFQAVRHLRRAKYSEGVTPHCTAAMLILVVFLAGLRPGEALGLMLEDIDLDRGFIRIRDNQHRRLIRSRYAERDVPIRLFLRLLRVRYIGRVRVEHVSGLLSSKPGNH
jgi:integrase